MRCRTPSGRPDAILIIVPRARGTETFARRPPTASAIAVATSSGSTSAIGRIHFGAPWPAESSVCTTPGNTAVTPMPFAASSMQRFGEPDDRVLGRAVGGQARECAHARERCDVDNMPAAVRHSRRGEFRTGEDAAQVDGDHAVGHVVGLVGEAAGRHDARVVHQHVQWAEPLLGRIEEPRERCPVGDVERQPAHQTAGHFGKLGRGLLDQRGIDVAERDPRTCAQKCRARRPADPSGSAGDRHHLATAIRVRLHRNSFRNTPLRTFPVSLRGSESRKITSLGTLCRASPDRT